MRNKEQLLIQQNRLAAMGEMINNIAHQWRQPLNMLGLLIQGFDLSYRKGEFSAEILHKTSEKAMQVIQHMSKTTDDFRNFFKPDKGKVFFEINYVVATTVSLLQGTFKSLEIESTVAEEGRITVEGYPNEFSHVIMNLLLNSKDVFAERGIKTPRIEIRIFQENGRAAVTITDNAGGIAESIMGKIFDPSVFSCRRRL